MDSLPEDIVFYIALDGNIVNIICRLNTYYNKLISDDFWKLKYLRDLGEPDYDIKSSWKIAYQSFGRIKSFGIEQFDIQVKHVSSERDCVLFIDVNNNVFKNNVNLNIKAKYISSGVGHSVLIDVEDIVWCLGNNDFGQLGMNDYMVRPYPVKMWIKAKFVACGGLHTMIIDLNDDVWSFGNNDCGQLGLGHDQGRILPVKIEGIKAKFVACGGLYTMIIDLNDNIYSFGSNEHCQLGLGDRMDRQTPTLIKNFHVKTISCGYKHTVFLDNDNKVWVCGDNKLGQLGINGRPVLITVPLLLDNIRAKFISCGAFHTMIINLHHEVLAFGCNQYHKLGIDDVTIMYVTNPHLISGIKANSILCGRNHTIIILRPD
jgi:alpha-tubulin suppressor-like RCC1 family protein